MSPSYIYRKIKKLIATSPLASNYIAATRLTKSLREAAPYVNGLVLDVGCGEKPHEPLFRSNVSKYIGIDLPASAYNFGEDWAADVSGNACQLPFKSGLFNTVICIGVLPHVAFPHQAFAEFSRTLKKGGILVLTAGKTWMKRVDLPIPDYWRFTDDGLRLLAENHHMEVIYTRGTCGYLAMAGAMLSRFLSKQFIYLGAMNRRAPGNPNIFAAIIVLPICAVIQVIALMLDKLYYSTLDTLTYVVVARKKG